jgi:hypothetical protein
MVRKVVSCQLSVVSLLLWLCCTACFAQSTSSTELIEQAKDYDAKTVTYQGEVIGEIMVRGDYVWVNVNDGQNAIGIWAKKDLIKGITYKGDYKHIGDRIEVLGVFHRACPQHGGDLDIHAQEIIKVAEGREIKFILDEGKIKLAIYLGVALWSLLILRSLKQRR